MATIAEQLSSYAASLRFEDFPPEVVRQAKRMIIDTLGCALGGYSSEPARIARDVATSVTSRYPATIIGSGQTTSPDMATFANGVMIRYLDFNDGYTSKESGHPSDSIAATLTCSEVAGASGQGLITATVLAYEAFCRICDVVDVKSQGFDHVTIGCIASILGAARSFGLSQEQTLQALNLGMAGNVALYQTRIGDVSMWKGCAYANASRNAVFAVMLAQRGLTGPSPIFEGDGGFFKAVSRQPFEIEALGGGDEPFKIMECSIKRFPLGQYSQTVVQAALEVRQQLPDPQDIAQVNIRTLERAVQIMAGDSEKWRPANRETADHSMPYTAAVALMHGSVSQEHFGGQFLGDPELLDLVSRVNVEVSEEANQRAPEAMLCDLEVVTGAGQRYSSQVAYHKGHYKNPLSDAEVGEKFRALASEHMTARRIDALLDQLWHLDEQPHLSQLIRLLRI
ncbi:MAG: MmgE/PrpD family protein [Chloroflexi bacterium]|nr:MmgE/PrpD family protein [Chloroflexota bacterium]